MRAFIFSGRVLILKSEPEIKARFLGFTFAFSGLFPAEELDS